MSELDGARRAAVLLMSLGEEAAASILRHVGSKNVQRVSQAMGDLKKVSWTQVNDVIANFKEEVKGETAFGLKAPDFTRKMLTSSLGEQQANAVMDRIGSPRTSPAIDALRWMDPRELADLIRKENPQVIATVLALMDGEESAALLEQFDAELAEDLLIRMARINQVPPAAMSELEALLNTGTLAAAGVRGSPIELKGPAQAAHIFNCLNSDREQELMQAVRDKDADLAQEIEELMFVFDNLMQLDDRGLQKLMREVPQDLLVPALKGADEALRERFFSNMSKRAAEMLKDDLDVSGPIRISDVESAHKEILSVARRLADEGTISLGGKGGDEFV